MALGVTCFVDSSRRVNHSHKTFFFFSSGRISDYISFRGKKVIFCNSNLWACCLCVNLCNRRTELRTSETTSNILKIQVTYLRYGWYQRLQRPKPQDWEGARLRLITASNWQKLYLEGFSYLHPGFSRKDPFWQNRPQGQRLKGLARCS